MPPGAHPVPFDDLEPFCFHLLQRPSSHVLTLEPAREELDELLKPEDGFDGAADVVDKDQLSSGPKDTFHFGNRMAGI